MSYAKSEKLVITLLLAISLFSNVSTDNFYVSTYQSLSLIQPQIIKDIQYVDNKIEIDLKLKDTSVKEYWGWKQQTFNATEVIVKDFKFNIDVKDLNITLSQSSSNITVDGLSFSLMVNFNYGYRCFCESHSTGKMIINSVNVKFMNYFERVNGTNKKLLLFSSDFVYGDVTLGGDYSEDSGVNSLAKKVIIGMIDAQGVKNIINERVTRSFNDYYSTEVEVNKLTFSTNVPYQNFTSTNYLYAIEPKNKEKGVVNYIDTVIEETLLKPIKENLQNKNTVNELWDDFDSSDGEFQIFFHQNILKRIADIINEKSQLYYTVTKENIPPNLNMKMDVSTIASFYNDVLNTRIPTEEIEINITGTRIDIGNINSKKFSLNLYTNNKFITMTDKQLVFEANINLTFIAILVLNGDFSINLNIDNSTLQLVDVIIPSNYPKVDNAVLNEKILQAYRSELQEKTLNIFRDNIPFEKYFLRIDKVKSIDGKGLLFSGVPSVRLTKIN